MSRKLQMALRLRENAEAHVAEILKSDYPVDSEISWRAGKRIYDGRVVMHCHGDRIKVVNESTQKCSFIRAFKVRT